MSSLKDIMRQFNLEGSLESYGNGHINDTYLYGAPEYILQRINTGIFKNPDQLMENIERVTAFLREKIAREGGDPDRETLTVVKTSDGKNYYRDGDNCYRVYKFVQGSLTIEAAQSPEDMRKVGEGFGRFQQQLSDFPSEKLFETIKDFHNTAKRFEVFEASVRENKAGRAESVRAEIDFFLSRKDITHIVTDGIASGEIPLRVTHNDTKINNILFDAKTRDVLCVIDLDTVMPGSVLYDFGDALRVGASTAAEDETDLEKVRFSTESFTAFTRGYLKETAGMLTESEVSLLAFSAKLLTFECGIRFLTDYLEGDTYFKIHREHHNLDRARNQFKLVAEIEKLEDELKETVYGIYREETK